MPGPKQTTVQLVQKLARSLCRQVRRGFDIVAAPRNQDLAGTVCEQSRKGPKPDTAVLAGLIR